MTLQDLIDQEYAPKVAEKEQHRAKQHNQKQEQQRQKATQPIADRNDLSDQVAQLANAWGLKKRQR